MEKYVPKISIILPVYNAGEHLTRCMDTLINQTLKELEIIAILDCPTDGSDKIIKDYASKDDRIIVLENETNLNVGLSRNKGLEIARGEYIGFSDHDDWRELNMYEVLYNKAKEENLDLVISEPTMCFTNKETEIRKTPQTDISFLKDYLLTDLIGWGNYSVLDSPAYGFIHYNLYKTDIIRKHDVQFVDTQLYAPEDVIFNIMFVFHIKVVNSISQSLYFHREHETSLGNGYSYKNWEKRANGVNIIYNFLLEKSIYEQYKPNFYICVHKEVLKSLTFIIRQRKGFLEFLSAFNGVKKYKFTKEAFQYYVTSHYNRGTLKNLFRRILALGLSI